MPQFPHLYKEMRMAPESQGSVRVSHEGSGSCGREATALGFAETEPGVVQGQENGLEGFLSFSPF